MMSKRISIAPMKISSCSVVIFLLFLLVFFPSLPLSSSETHLQYLRRNDVLPFYLFKPKPLKSLYLATQVKMRYHNQSQNYKKNFESGFLALFRSDPNEKVHFKIIPKIHDLRCEVK